MKTLPLTMTKRDHVVQLLRRAILSGRLKPGDRVYQERLAAEFEVSPTPMREALRQLEAEGLVKYTPHKGATVAEINLEELRDVYRVRRLVEGLATELAATRLDESRLALLAKTHKRMVRTVERGALSGLWVLSHEFHMLIYGATGSHVLTELIEFLWARFPRDNFHDDAGRAQACIVEHEAILNAIQERNADQAASLMQEHIERSWEALAGYYEKSG